MQVANIATIAALAKNSALQTKKSIAEALAAAGLRKNRADEVLAFRTHIFAQRKARQAAHPGSGRPVINAVKRGTPLKRYTAQLTSSVRELLRDVYRMAAHGTLTVGVTRDPAAVGVVQVESTSYDVYGGAFKNRPCRIQDTHVTVPFSWVRRVQRARIDFADGMFTLDAARIESEGCDLYAATWIEQGRGTSLHTRRGYIARQGGLTFHAATARDAVTGLARKARARSLEMAVSGPSENLAELIAAHASMRVTLADARAVGACEYGIRSWCNTVGLDYAAGVATLAEIFAAYLREPRAEARSVMLRVLKRSRALAAVAAVAA